VTDLQRETAASWMFNEWGPAYAAFGVTSVAEVLDSYKKVDETNTFLGFVGETPVASVGIEKFDMHDRMHLSPWLTVVFVAPDYRHHSLGSRMVRHALQAAAEQDGGVGRLHLWCPRRLEGWYARLGFTTLEHREYCGEDAAVMQH
jgi:GNAT superfamily N-acetyltransferase